MLPKEAYDDLAVYEAIHKYHETNSNDPECSKRYLKGTNAAREWMCYSRWKSEESKADNIEYRDLLLAWMTPVDITYVLQFEFDPDNVRALEHALVRAVRRENTPERLDRRRRCGPLSAVEDRLRHGSGGLGGNMCRSANTILKKYLEGDSIGTCAWIHPDYRLHCAWWNRYARVSMFKDMFEDGTMRYK